MLIPRKLKRGDRVAAISLSWGGPHVFPHRYETGKRQFEEAFGVNVVETEHALKDPQWLFDHPEARAEDLMNAFADDSIAGIITTIGGDDSIRTLPFMDLDVIRKHPKIFMGYSDTTISHAVCFKAGLVSFYGPTFMAGFGENQGLFPYLRDSVEKTLFKADPLEPLAPNPTGWTVEMLDWADPANQSIRRTLNPSAGWQFHQEEGVAEGPLFGGCLEVLDWLRGTDYWPDKQRLTGAVLFLETSEEGPPPTSLRRFLRCLATMGSLESLSGILLGRPGGPVKPDVFPDYAQAVLDTLRGEYGLSQISVVSNMDFGHTDPIFVIPQGLSVSIDSSAQELRINRAAVKD